MIILRIAMDVIPEKHLELTQTLLSIAESTGKEQGCLSYSVSCDVESRNHFNVLEEWGTRGDLEDHIKSYRFGALLGAKALLREPPKIQIQTVSRSEGMEVIVALRANTGQKE